MKKLTGNEIIRTYIEFFKEKEHIEVESASLIPHDDPTVLWINAGVTPLKNWVMVICLNICFNLIFSLYSLTILWSANDLKNQYNTEKIIPSKINIMLAFDKAFTISLKSSFITKNTTTAVISSNSKLFFFKFFINLFQEYKINQEDLFLPYRKKQEYWK